MSRGDDIGPRFWRPSGSAQTCPDCQSPMKIKSGPHGRFWSCTQYPECKGTRDFTTTMDENERGAMERLLKAAAEFVILAGGTSQAHAAIQAVELLLGGGRKS